MMRRVLIVLAFVVAVLAFLMRAYERWWFPRDPARSIDPSARIVAPADGRVVYVEEVQEGVVPLSVKRRTEIPLDEIVKGNDRPPAGTLVGIFMSPFDVHYQRSPIAGVVSEVSHHAVAKNHVMGSMFLRDLIGIEPYHAKSPHIYENERNVIRIDGSDMSAFVVQIADQQVDMIDCYVGVGDRVEMGSKVGMIRRGSQVDLFLSGLYPSDLPGIEVGARVFAGETVLAW